MYLYYDRYGTLKEQITFNPARVGNSNVNKIFVYWEGVEEFPDWAQELALQTRYLLQDNTQYPSATTFGFSAQPETAELPFDKNQDLKYFKYYKEYKFLTIDIPDEVLSYNGAVKSYIWVLNADKKRILGLGVFAFMVDGDINEVIPDENISLAQWNMISAQLGLLSGSVIDVTCDIETNTLKVYYANGLTAIRNLPPNGAQTTISPDFLREMIFSADAWVQDGENGYYIYFRAETVGYTDNRFFVQLEKNGEYNSDYYNKTGSFVLSDNIFKGSDGSVLLYSNEPYSGRLLVVGGKLLSGDSLVTGLTYNDVNSQLSYKTADGITHSIYLGINEKFDKSNITQTIGDSTDKVMSQKAVTDNFARLVDGKVPENQLPSYVDDVLEYDSKDDFPAIGEEGKIYVDKSTNLTYRWSGSTYIQVGGGDLALENGTGDVLIQTTDSNHSFKVLTDGRAKVQSAPVDDDDVVRKQELDTKLNKTNVVQTTGDSETDVMSQKAVTDELNRRTITSAGAPTTSTVGTVGLIYEDTTNGKLYQCTAINSGVYTWVELLQDKPCELIEEITLTEDTKTIIRLFNNFLTKLFVRIEAPAQTSASSAYINVDIKGTIISELKVATVENYIKTSQTYSFVDVSINNNMIKNYSSSGVENKSSNSELTCLSGSYGTMGFGDIKGIIFNASSAKNIPTGTVIKIYGVRAK